MLSIPPILESRKNYCKERLVELSFRIGEIPELSASNNDLCIYVTGSYGRLEASQYSDLDLFFIIDDAEIEQTISPTNKTLIDAELIKIALDMGFGEFSDEGKYLQIHSLSRVLESLGSPADDYENLFTARMLLLLESIPAYNESTYSRIIGKTIESYYRDYSNHEENFRPLFLVNDIKRYWYTLTLNYENKRHRRTTDRAKVNASHLKNLKLKFSRRLMCFSMIACLSEARRTITQDELVDLVRISPIERLINVARSLKDGDRLISEILEEYTWFLEHTESPKDQLLSWIENVDNRKLAFSHADSFRVKLSNLIRELADDETLSYLIM